MAHGITLQMRYLKRPEPEVLHVGSTYVNPVADRALAGKARRRARRAVRALTRRPFFSGHGVASENAYNLRYDCPCGYGIVAPLDDLEFMTEVMDHETQHTEAAAR